ncbi:Acyl-CoA dehydrogenase C-terminal domain-containing protein, partial [Porphyromonas gingivalis]|uniref:Acyl-CoA dehydrogenase C-terminal domain-containing protein n=1 Tax=Porphyromonas gingivalis TaxID=837 RepID=UPI00211C4970
FQARRLVEMTAHAVFGHLLMLAANDDDSFRQSAEVYLRYGQASHHESKRGCPHRVRGQPLQDQYILCL